MIRSSLIKPAVLLFCMTLAACAPTLVIQGYVPDEDTLAGIEQGFQNHSEC